MTTLTQMLTGFAAAVVDALTSHICVLNRDGVVIAVNRAWRNFGAENSAVSCRSNVGAHYLEVCRSAVGDASEEAHAFSLGVQSVLNGETQLFQMEYPCHSPNASRWFLGRATPLEIEQGGAVISHLNITDRKLLESELAKLASTDPLTGLPNRRHFLEIANRELERVRRFGATASVMMIDLDHFKSVNDTYGHAVGDEALRCLTKACNDSIRKVDMLARIGGEEFAVLMPGTNKKGAIDAAENLRRTVYQTSVTAGHPLLRLTTSIGIAEVLPSDRSIDNGLGRADAALYQAKKLGRNRVESSGIEAEPGQRAREMR